MIKNAFKYGFKIVLIWLKNRFSHLEPVFLQGAPFQKQKNPTGVNLPEKKNPAVVNLPKKKVDFLQDLRRPGEKVRGTFADPPMTKIL